jgi:hypothetical protein
MYARTLAFGAVLLATRVAQAGEPVSLTWNAPPGCPSGEAVLADVQRTLGGVTSRRVVARADVSEIGPEHWSVRLTTDVEGAQGERTLDANSCASLASATALILAWTVDPSKAPMALVPTQAAAVPPSVTRERDEASPAPRGRSIESSPLLAVVAASGAGDLGTLPGVGASGEIAVGALFGPIRAELAGADWLAQDAIKPVRPGTLEGAHIHLLDARLRGCFRGRFTSRFELDPCLGAAILSASSEGLGSAPTFTPLQKSGAWGDLQVDALAAWRLFGPLALRASVGIWIPLARPSFVVDLQSPGAPAGEFVLHRAEPVGARATLGVEARFP